MKHRVYLLSEQKTSAVYKVM